MNAVSMAKNLSEIAARDASNGVEYVMANPPRQAYGISAHGLWTICEGK